MQANAEMGGVVLEDDKHNGGECDHPEEGVSVERSRGDVRSPVARVYEAHGHQKTGAYVPENFKRPVPRGVISFHIHRSIVSGK
jgi:hypothetical protein